MTIKSRTFLSPKDCINSQTDVVADEYLHSYSYTKNVFSDSNPKKKVNYLT